ncbi:hypothetical protein L2E82_31910 [Cichorium intybus]|uniref:Uncharacterized protein n=1 Tax=Cichorium intybus TaxID=13427 RepID=A0ACB9BGK4_CICIN|nr:hypothetical protein L2E82_31910 [Cichorium intybus]
MFQFCVSFQFGVVSYLYLYISLPLNCISFLPFILVKSAKLNNMKELREMSMNFPKLSIETSMPIVDASITVLMMSPTLKAT